MEKKIDSKNRPGFHLAARVGWMNDPNGFSYYKGEYHMFSEMLKTTVVQNCSQQPVRYIPQSRP